MTNIDTARARPKAHLHLFRYSGWDAVPAIIVVVQAMALVAFVAGWGAMGWPARLGGGVICAFCIGWTLDAAAHNFVHNPYFVSERLNRVTALLFSIELGVPHTVYHYNHMRHHAGSSDRIGADGRTLDPISLYQYGRGGRVEGALSYVFLQYWRDESPLKVIRAIRAKRPGEAREAVREGLAMLAVYAGLLAIDWRACLFLLPFFYLGQCFSYLIAYYEHLGADPEAAIPTGVSTYGALYNRVFMNNGFHAEHHHRPKAHWTRMASVTAETRAAMGEAGIRTLRPPHFLGFLDPEARRVPADGLPRGSEAA